MRRLLFALLIALLLPIATAFAQQQPAEADTPADEAAIEQDAGQQPAADAEEAADADEQQPQGETDAEAEVQQQGPSDTFSDVPKVNLPEEKGIIEAYTDYVDRMIAEVDKLDIYGNTGQLPKGILKVQYKYNMRSARERFYGTGDRGKIIQPMDFGDIVIDLNGKGFGFGHTFQISYGITDPLDYYVEFPFQVADVRMNPIFINRGADVPGSAGWLIETRFGPGIEGFCQALEEMGRPCPTFSYRSDGWEFGDMHTGLSWNFYKTEEFSTSLTGRIFLPTGRVADPNESLFFALGAQIDAGLGAWGLGETFTLDYRPWWLGKYIIFSHEMTWQYAFPTKRRYPTVFKKPTQAGEQLKTQLGPEMATYFPDLSDLHGYYTYEPGFLVDGNVSMTVDLKVMAVAIQYSWGMAQDPKIKSDNKEFVTMVRALEMVAYEDQQVLGIGVQTPVLLALRIPVFLSFQTEIAQSGRNSLIFYDNYTFGAQVFLPINPDF